MKRTIPFLIIFPALILLSEIAIPCTTFLINKDGEIIFGKNYDWMTGTGMLVVNKAGIKKNTFGENPIQWKSRYGSVTFNQYGKEFPSGGMNEKGLVIELLWLEETEYPGSDERAQIGILQWIQYNMDNSETVQDVINTDKVLRPTSRSAKVHYLIADGQGNAASIEFIDGKMVSRTSELMPYTALTNSTYDESVSFHKKRLESMEEYNQPSVRGSFERFSDACILGENYDRSKGSAIDYGFDILSNVAQGEYTQWSIIYDIKNKSVNFRTNSFNDVRTLNYNNVDFSCKTESTILDLEEKVSGDISGRMINFSISENTDIIRKAYSEVPFLKNVSEEEILSTAEIPAKFTCEDKEYLKNQIVSVGKDNGSNLIYLVLSAGLVVVIVVSLLAGRHKKVT